MLKLRASDLAMRMTTEVVQLLGGYGYCKDYRVERLMRDAKITQIWEGTNQIHRQLIGRSFIREMSGEIRTVGVAGAGGTMGAGHRDRRRARRLSRPSSTTSSADGARARAQADRRLLREVGRARQAHAASSSTAILGELRPDDRARRARRAATW